MEKIENKTTNHLTIKLYLSPEPTVNVTAPLTTKTNLQNPDKKKIEQKHPVTQIKCYF